MAAAASRGVASAAHPGGGTTQRRAQQCAAHRSAAATASEMGAGGSGDGGGSGCGTDGALRRPAGMRNPIRRAAALTDRLELLAAAHARDGGAAGPRVKRFRMMNRRGDYLRT